MNRAVLLLLAVALLATGGYFLLGSESGVLERSDDVVAADRAQPSDPSGEIPVDLVNPEIGEREVERASAPAVATAGPAAEAAASAGTADEPVALGKVTGRVTDVGGAPVARAEVTVHRRDLDEILSVDLNGGVSAAKRPEALTDGEGRFELEVKPGSLRLEVQADGYAPLTSMASLMEGATEDLGDLRLATGVILRGRVVDSGGNGIPGAELIRESKPVAGITVLSADRKPATVTGPGGEFEILRQAAGPYKFFVQHDRYPGEELAGQVEAPGETVSDLLVTLADGATIRGLAQGVPEDVTGLQAYAALGAGGGFDFDLAMGLDRSRSVPVAADGTFDLAGLVPGARYRVQLFVKSGGWSGRDRRSQWVMADAPMEGLGEVVQVPYSLGATVSFTVVDDQGRGLLPDRVEAGFDYQNPWSDIETDEDTGRHVLKGVWPDEEGQDFTVNLMAKGFEDWSQRGIKVYPGEAVDLGTATLKPRPSVRVTVVDDVTGEPVEGARVEMGPVRSEVSGTRVSMRFSMGSEEEPSFDRGAERSGRTDENGVCTLDATAGEAVRFSVSDNLHAPTVIDRVVLPESMSVFEQELRLAEGGGIRLTALDPAGVPASGLPLEFKDDDPDSRMSRSGRTGDDGVLELVGLTPGEHLVRLGKRRKQGGIVMPRISGMSGRPSAGDDESWTAVTVLAGQVTDLALEAPALGTLAGTVKELGAALGGATVKLRPLDDDNPLAGMLMFGGGGHPTATTDARGEFTIEDVEAGEYELEIEHPTRVMPAVLAQEMKAGRQEVEVDLSVTEVTGQVLDATGEPVAGARVEAKEAPKEGEPAQQVVSVMMMTSDAGGGGGSVVMSYGQDEAEPVRTNENGEYRLRGVKPGVDLVVEAAAPGFDAAKSEPFSVAEGSEETGVDVTFKTPGAIRIEVEGMSGRVLATIRKSRSQEQPKIEMMHEATTLVNSLAPGTWTVTLRSMDGTELNVEPEEREVEVVAGETVTASFVIR